MTRQLLLASSSKCAELLWQTAIQFRVYPSVARKSFDLGYSVGLCEENSDGKVRSERP